MTEEEHITFLKDQLFTLRLRLGEISSKARVEALYSDEEKRKVFRKLGDMADDSVKEIDKAREQIKTYS
jgi:hypothetical protein